MPRLQVFIFCIVSLAGTLAVYAALFPHTSMSPAEVEAARKPQPMEEFDLIDLGSDYGQLTVFELVGYYLENPTPAAAAGEAAPRKKHFGGC